MNYSLVVHGGAGIWKGARRRKGLHGVRRAASNGVDILRNGGTALDAVESSVVIMEDDSTFNAGYGSALNLLGQVEMDASIMDGQTLQAGAVALVTRVKNPIRLARLVMEKTYEWWPCYGTFQHTKAGDVGILRGSGNHEFSWEAKIPEGYPEGEYTAFVGVYESSASGNKCVKEKRLSFLVVDPKNAFSGSPGVTGVYTGEIPWRTTSD